MLTLSCLSVGIAIVTAIALYGVSSRRHAWILTLAAAVDVLVARGGVAFLSGRLMSDPAVLMPLVFSMLCLVAISVMPRSQNSNQHCRTLLLLLASGLTIFDVADLRLLYFAWIVGPLLVASRKRARVFLYYHGLSCAFFAGGLFLLSHSPAAAGICFALAAMIRQGVFPFHAGQLSLANESGEAALFATLLAPTGIALFIRTALPLSPAALHILVSVVTLGSLYLAVLSLAQRKLMGLTLVSSSVQASLAFASYLVSTGLGALPAGLQWIALTIATVGLSLVCWLFKARTGADDLAQGGGWKAAQPALAIFFLVFSFAMTGLPGSLEFVSEDAVAHSLLGISYLHFSVALLAVGLVAIAFYRMYVRFFLGPASELPMIIELQPRERLGLATLVAVVIGMAFIGI